MRDAEDLDKSAHESVCEPDDRGMQDFESYVADVARLEAGKGEPEIELEACFRVRGR